MTDEELQDDSFKSWQLAIAEMRKKGLREGLYKPSSDEEWEYLASEFNGIETF